MNAVLGMNELLGQTVLTSRQRYLNDTVNHSAKHLLDIINNILDFSKIETGKLELHAKEFNLLDQIEDILELIAVQADEKGLILNFDFPIIELEHNLLGDALRLRQVLINLLGNAIKFTEQGGVSLSVKLLRNKNDVIALRFMVRDSGSGIESEKKDLVFKSFVQADSGITRKYGGTGLGLAISNQLVKLMGGEINLASEVNKGSCFSFDLAFSKSARREIELWNVKEGCKLSILMPPGTEYSFLNQVLTLHNIPYKLVSNLAELKDELFAEAATGKPYKGVLISAHYNVQECKQIFQFLAENSAVIPRPMTFFIGKRNEVEQLNSVFDDEKTRIIKLPLTQGSIKSVLFDEEERADFRDELNVRQPSALSAHILVVEDNLINREVLKDMLQQLNCTFDEACDGEEAVHAFQNDQYDLILMDYHMPNKDGLQATVDIREYERQHYVNQHIPIILITADIQKELRIESEKSGIDDLLLKPCSLQQLEEKLLVYLPTMPSTL